MGRVARGLAKIGPGFTVHPEQAQTSEATGSGEALDWTGVPARKNEEARVLWMPCERREGAPRGSLSPLS